MPNLNRIYNHSNLESDLYIDPYGPSWVSTTAKSVEAFATTGLHGGGTFSSFKSSSKTKDFANFWKSESPVYLFEAFLNLSGATASYCVPANAPPFMVHFPCLASKLCVSVTPLHKSTTAFSLRRWQSGHSIEAAIMQNHIQTKSS